MPKPLMAGEVDSRTDSEVAKQWDNTTPKKDQLQASYKLVDRLKVGLLATIGPFSRSL